MKTIIEPNNPDETIKLRVGGEKKCNWMKYIFLFSLVCLFALLSRFFGT